MKRSIAVLLTLTFALTFSACRSREKSASEISNDLENKGTTELLKEASKDKYDPPADGHLTDAQIEMYIKVRQRERDIALQARKELEQHAEKAKAQGDKSIGGVMEALKGMGSAADFVTADIRAAQELGYNTAEYTWVKSKVLEASGAALTEKFHAELQGNIQKAYEETKKQYDATQDPTAKKALGDLLKNYEDQLKNSQPDQEDPSIAYNRQLLSKHEDALNAITTELSKYDEHPGEAAGAMKALENTSTQGSEQSQQ